MAPAFLPRRHALPMRCRSAVDLRLKRCRFVAAGVGKGG